MVFLAQFVRKAQFVPKRGFFLYDDGGITVLVCAQTLCQVALQAHAEE